MFRFVNIILLHCVLIAFSQNNATSTVCDCNCNCDFQIEVINDNLDEEMPKRSSKPSSCMEATASSSKSGVYEIQIQNLNVTDVEVFCEEGVDLGGWLVIQRRQSDSVNFTRNWRGYKEGFGNITENYWIGLEKLHALTNNCEQELYIQMKRRNGREYHAKYSEFLIGNEVEGYALKKLSDYSGDAGDAFRLHRRLKFSTYDRDNDSDLRNCAQLFKGGWWFDECYYCNLNGVYGDDRGGVNWRSIEDNESLSFAQMLIRPNRNCLRRLMLRN
ncbi:angiopoietin-related protein 2-like [Zeugodacus cucurbitae]|uniref:angiopoietin-related protein 2-like n=1 Tax=Zeugodacus cucurbitae TaxID=28588 RepID=UPI0023D8EA86|nr:angiopoietin-related protein 2-like [Zeugodacus cucurbitae]